MSARFFLAAALFVGLAALVRDAAAANDVVVLQDGSVLSGEATEIVPGVHVVLSGAGGSRKVPWSRVRQISRDGRPLIEAPPTAMPPPPKRTDPPPPPPGAAQPDSRLTVRVTLTAPPGKLLVEQLDPTTGAFFLVCEDACREPLLTDVTYRVRLDGVVSTSFQLSSRDGHTQRLVLRPPHRGAQAGFIVMTCITGTGVFSGAVMMLLGAGDKGGKTLLVAGSALTAPSAALLVVSIPMVVLSGQPRVEVDRPPSRALADGRDPAAVVPMPAVQTAPIFGGTF